MDHAPDEGPGAGLPLSHTTSTVGVGVGVGTGSGLHPGFGTRSLFSFGVTGSDPTKVGERTGPPTGTEVRRSLHHYHVDTDFRTPCVPLPGPVPEGPSAAVLSDRHKNKSVLSP